MIHLSSAAARHVTDHLVKRGRGVGIRVGVKTAGCSGLSYVLEYVDVPSEHDQVFDSQGVKVFIDPKSLVYLDGMTMDFVTEGLNSGFRFDNPNKTGECGCGESFTV